MIKFRQQITRDIDNFVTINVYALKGDFEDGIIKNMAMQLNNPSAEKEELVIDEMKEHLVKQFD